MTEAASGKSQNALSSIADPLDSARREFASRFSGEPSWIARAPGRVELLGNHTDYNGGLVMSCAIDRETVAAGRPRSDRLARVASANIKGASGFVSFDIDHPPGAPQGSWINYVQGVVHAWNVRKGPLSRGFELAIAGNVPLGAGLSSSASLQVAVAWFLSALENDAPETDAERMELAHLTRQSENEFVGVSCGLLDMFSSLMGRANHALMLDCRSLDFERLPMGSPDSAPTLAVCNSMTSRRLADGMYNQRRSECERVLVPFGLRSLRDLTMEELEERWDEIDLIAASRAKHVLGENRRVQQGAEALKRGDLAVLGRLMRESHESSRLLFENSSTALDALIESAEQAPGFLGGKLSGAGWAGCTVNLVETPRAQEFVRAVVDHYQRKTGLAPEIHLCRAGEGARLDGK